MAYEAIDKSINDAVDTAIANLVEQTVETEAQLSEALQLSKEAPLKNDVLRVEGNPDANVRAEWVEYFKNLTEQLLATDVLTAKAIDVYMMSVQAGSPDGPGEALGQLMESHFRFKENMCKNLMQFVSQNILYPRKMS